MSIPEAEEPTAREPEVTPQHVSLLSPPALVLAVIWAIAAVIMASVLLLSANDIEYDGDAYTGIQNAVNLAVRGIAFLLFGSAALGLVIATRRDRR